MYVLYDSLNVPNVLILNSKIGTHSKNGDKYCPQSGLWKGPKIGTVPTKSGQTAGLDQLIGDELKGMVEDRKYKAY